MRGDAERAGEREVHRRGELLADLQRRVDHEPSGPRRRTVVGSLVEAEVVERLEDVRVVAAQCAEDVDDQPVLGPSQRRVEGLATAQHDRQDDRPGRLPGRGADRAADGLDD